MQHTAKQIVFEQALKDTDQYTCVNTIGNSVYARARRNDGTPVYVEQKYLPTYYLPVAQAHAAQATHVGYEGQPLIPHMCTSIWEAKDFTKTSKVPVYGDIQFEYMMLADVYGNKDVPYDPDVLYIWDIDIEVDSENAFAKPEDPFAEVTAITVHWWHMGKSGTVVYGRKDYTPKGNELYLKFDTEEALLLTFLDHFRSAGDYPDIVTGWNVSFYDIPYLLARMKLLFTEEVWIRLSPFQNIAERTVTLNGRDSIAIDLKGIAVLDYYELYRKFTYAQRENYRLDTIAHYELKKRKVSFKEYKNLRTLYRLNHQLFIEYNVQDVLLVKELDDKLKLIDLVCALGYTAKSNFVDCFRQVRLWDIMIYHKLRAEGKQIPPRKDGNRKDSQYAGAFVKETVPGFYKWVVSFDVASMYPHIIREWNLSPETKLLDKVTGLMVKDVSDRNTPSPAMMAMSVDTTPIKQKDVCLACNGVLTNRHQEGFLPNMLKTLYDERNRFKKLMKQAKTAAENEPDAAKKAALKKQQAAYNNAQQVRKVNLNSAYGAMGSEYFRFFDVDLAEAVTVTGQFIIQRVAQDINDYLNKILKTNKDYIIASDTDSVYVDMEDIAKLAPEGTPTAKMVDLLNDFGEKKIMPIINKCFENIASYLNVAVPCLSMVRDVIADKAVWTAKKHYIMNVYDSEGTRYKEPELKMMGIETIKSSTPEVVRDMMTKSLKILMTGTQEQLWEHIAESEQKFRSAGFEDIAFPRSANNLAKYAGRDKGVPIHVRAVLTFNDALQRTGLAHMYEPVREGEKIKFAYLREPNPFFSHVIGATHGCPPEWDIEKWLDYETQFDKTFREPLNAILTCAGWTLEQEASLW